VESTNQPAYANVDSIIVPAREEGFRDVFMGENRWYPVWINARMRRNIKYIAVYRAAPVSAITHIARVRSVEAWHDSHKLVVNFGPPKRIGPIPLVKKGRIAAPQRFRYASRKRIEQAKTLDDIW
jgi:hypothetical protein